MLQRRFEILDCHVHFFTKSIRDAWEKQRATRGERMARAAARNHERHMQKANNLQWEYPEDADDAATRWLAELDRAGVHRAAFMAPFAENAELRRFLSHSNRLIGLSWLNPTLPDAPTVLERERAAGLVGVKLYPVTAGYRLNDRRAWPFYEAAERTGMFVMVHYGVTIGYNADLNFANPLDLHAVARDFPDVSFVVSHFGAGFMRECLMLAYQVENVLFDTSGSNNWLRTQPEKMSLKRVFERFIEGAGTERILYGSDSTNFPRGYRVNVLEEQLDILETLDITDADRASILGGNLKRLMARNEPSWEAAAASEEPSEDRHAAFG